jgi:hypothetical protein
MTVPIAEPLNVMLAPAPLVAGPMLPEMLHVELIGCAAKLTAV